jgi:hypothetical protein
MEHLYIVFGIVGLVLWQTFGRVLTRHNKQLAHVQTYYCKKNENLLEHLVLTIIKPSNLMYVMYKVLYWMLSTPVYYVAHYADLLWQK